MALAAPTPILIEPRPAAATWVGSRLAAYVALTKPRIAVMVLLTVAAGFALGAPGAAKPGNLLLTLLGTGLVAGGASAWNQFLERERDGRMRRTATRPLPGGRIFPAEAAAWGTLLGVLGVAILTVGPHPLAAGVAAATFGLYAFVYTPLKSRTVWNTAIGAIPGALPPVIGWAGATGRIGVEAFALFLIVFLWQFPHFLAIAWLHRRDYAVAGLRMLPTVDPSGTATGRQAAANALALVPAGMLPAAVGLGGPFVVAGALILGLLYLAYAARFCWDISEMTARSLLRASFLYLPAMLLLLVGDALLW